MDTSRLFTDRRITQMGLGLLGRGVGDAAFLARSGAELIVTDLKDEEALQPSLEQLASYPSITYRLGDHQEVDFEDRDLILKGPSVPLRSEYIAHARKSRIPIDMSASLFARIANIPIVGVTGTRGKSTVTHLVDAILRAAGRETLLGGNVRGVSNLALLEQVHQDHLGVFELDSWQCQGFGEERSLNAFGVRQGPLSPQVAVFTTFMPDHLNYYQADMAVYLNDKANIFLHQAESDTLVVGRQVLDHLARYKKRIKSHVLVADASDVPGGWGVVLPGEHNRYNVGIAVTVARTLGVDDEVIRSVVESFRALPGRLELIREAKGVAIYNDSNSTTPDATAAALRALDPAGKKNIVLIMGGESKQIEPTVLTDEVGVHAKAVVLLPGSGTDTLVFSDDTPSEQAATLPEALEQACRRCEPGDVLLFSPGFTSFGMFKNEYERGEAFNRSVRNLVSTHT